MPTPRACQQVASLALPGDVRSSSTRTALNLPAGTSTTSSFPVVNMNFGDGTPEGRVYPASHVSPSVGGSFSRRCGGSCTNFPIDTRNTPSADAPYWTIVGPPSSRATDTTVIPPFVSTAVTHTVVS